MFENFKMIEPLFEDQVHERHQFVVTMEGEEYTGILEDGEIIWYHPKPDAVKADEQMNEIEIEVKKLIGQQVK
ncbi:MULTISPECIES: hypothetical protein [Sporosarcina]|uniref:hypothetical protein n=1 Tax=Sporosarcina TaxID=1569 RepID=UPI00129AD861|nr:MULTISPECIES: hypothetical protein [Sporosarcina]GKV63980.1 hypothetical protein NCCP2331_01330 [Sporosarcina sp. NCCP-2331]GLB54761.1 hypothetical protein NCCP2378_05460 [Sporosarcina sp. NCCP-2378]